MTKKKTPKKKKTLGQELSKLESITNKSNIIITFELR